MSCIKKILPEEGSWAFLLHLQISNEAIQVFKQHDRLISGKANGFDSI
jgi:hypothetical protein